MLHELLLAESVRSRKRLLDVGYPRTAHAQALARRILIALLAVLAVRALGHVERSLDQSFVHLTILVDQKVKVAVLADLGSSSTCSAASCSRSWPDRRRVVSATCPNPLHR